MFVFIKGKRIICVLVLVCVGLIFSAGANITTNVNKERAVIVTANMSGKKIIIDAGHGLPDGGSVGVNGTIESEINLKIAKKVQKLIEESGNTCIMTRIDENGISGLENSTIRQKHVADLKNRVKIGNESNADVFVSIHLNKIPQGSYSGWQAFYKKDNDNSKKLAESIQQEIKEIVQIENKRKEAKISGVYIVDNINIPITVVECGFLSNVEEEKMLNTDEYQNKLAQGIFNGIMKYFY